MAGIRENAGKIIMSAITPLFRRGVAEVLTDGAVKYDRNNWMKGLSYSETLDSLHRHLMKIELGEELDDESGLHHIYHVATNVMFLAHFFEHPGDYAEFDDRAYAYLNEE